MNFDGLKAHMDSLSHRESVAGIAPGSNIVIYKNHKKIFSYSTGLADIENNIPTTVEHAYDIYSCSKITTAVAAMQLIERKVISLDDPVAKYIPEFADIKVKVKDDEGNVIGWRVPASEVQIKHLLTMTSGMGYSMHSPSICKVMEETDGRAPTVLVAKAMVNDGLDFDPGDRYQYSESLDVMGAVVEIAAGMPFSKFVEENIFTPLGMKNTTYHPDVNAPMRSVQYAYGGYGKPLVRCAPEFNPHRLGREYDGGGAGISSSASDYVLLMDALACGGVGATGNRILKSETVDLLRTPALTERQARTFKAPYVDGYAYCYGVRVCTDPVSHGNLATPGEFGWDGWKMSYAFADPTLGISVCFTTSLDEHHDTYLNPLRNAIYKCFAE